MLRSSIQTASVVLLGATAFAQLNVRQPQPITGPVKFAGVYHVGTGTWTRPHEMGNIAAVTGAGTIYDNSCDTNYYNGMILNETDIDEGRLPSLTSPVVAGLAGNDSEVGTQNSYQVDGFEFAWCTNDTVAQTWIVNFYEAYTPCGVRPALATAGFNLPGLNGSNALGTNVCWFGQFDLAAQTLSFTMAADADGSNDLTVNLDSFGWSSQPTTPNTQATPIWGNIIAGGAPNGTSFQTCSGSDGTIFDTGTISAVYPQNDDTNYLWEPWILPNPPAIGEAGTGMGAQNFFRAEASPTDGCVWFGGTPLGQLHLELWSNNVTLVAVNPMVSVCDPGTGGVINCPCSNPPAGSGRGCDNSAATGGASLAASGVANLASDSLVFTTANQRPSGTSILMQGTTQVTAGVAFGQGVRCVGGSLKRLYTKTASGGSITAPVGADPTVSARSATLGDTIVGGTHRFYLVYYRDPVVLGGCSALATFNCTQTGDVLWN